MPIAVPGSRQSPGARALVLAMLLAGAVSPRPAGAVDEIQVYNADISEVGQWTVEQHLNYALQGRTQPEFSGGLVANHALNGTPELAYGLTEWWELGFYVPFAVNSADQLLSDGFKIRTLFVSPHAGERSLFYGVNFEGSYTTPSFSQSRYAFEIRPIIGVRNADWEFIVNPIVDFGVGQSGEADFAPAARLARQLAHDVFVGLEYYGDYGKVGNFLPIKEQQHQLFAVTDFKVGMIDVEFGLGYGLTAGSDRLVAKTILGYAFPVPGQAEGNGDHSPKTPLATRAEAARNAWSPAPDPPTAVR